MSLADFHGTLAATLPGAVPFPALPWPPRVHLAVFAHRVDDLEPGLYLLLRDPAREADLRPLLREEFVWERPAGTPAGLPLVRLHAADVRGLAARLSCDQEIAGDGCFSLGMIAELEGPVRSGGAWVYPRLYWECGAVGQVLYLEAEARGLSGTGIGCYYDEPVHGVLGLRGRAFQSLYHFTMGGSVPDPRVTSRPPYGSE